jgi:hypothetical protein
MRSFSCVCFADALLPEKSLRAPLTTGQTVAIMSMQTIDTGRYINMFMIKLTPHTVSKDEDHEIWVNPKSISSMMRHKYKRGGSVTEYTVVMTVNGFIGRNVKETPEWIMMQAGGNKHNNNI